VRWRCSFEFPAIAKPPAAEAALPARHIAVALVEGQGIRGEFVVSFW